MEIKTLSLDLIEPDPGQPRKNKPPEYIQELGNSIEQKGLKNAIHVRVHPDDPDRFMLVNGECRFLAHVTNEALKETGEIYAIVVDSDNPLEIFLDQIIDNETRLNMAPMETISAYGKVIEMGGDVEGIASALGKSPATINADLELLRLPELIRQKVDEGSLPKAVAREIAKQPTDSRMSKAYGWAVKGKNVDGMLAKIKTYDNQANQVKIDALWGKDEPADKLKEVGKSFDRLQKAITIFANSPASNGKGGVMVKARSKKLGMVEETAKQMQVISKKILGDCLLWRAQDKHATV